MWDQKNFNPKIETGYAFKPHMNDVFVNDIKKLLIKMILIQLI